MRPEYPDVYGAITTGVTAREAAGIPEGSRLPGICHLTGTAQVIPHNRNLPPVKVWRAVSWIAKPIQTKARSRISNRKTEKPKYSNPAMHRIQALAGLIISFLKFSL